MTQAQKDAIDKARELLAEHFDRAVIIAESDEPNIVCCYPCGIESEVQEIGLIEMGRLRVRQSIVRMFENEDRED